MKSPFIQIYFPGRKEPAKINRAVNTALLVFAFIIAAMFAYGIYLSVKPDSPTMPKIAKGDKNESSSDT